VAQGRGEPIGNQAAVTPITGHPEQRPFPAQQHRLGLAGELVQPVPRRLRIERLEDLGVALQVFGPLNRVEPRPLRQVWIVVAARIVARNARSISGQSLCR